MKSNSTFKLNRVYKRLLALTYDDAARCMLKGVFIEAQLSEEAAKNKRFKESEENS